jgi:copper oxidase (laccase) domain-containing protein
MNNTLIFNSSKITDGNMSYRYGVPEEVDTNRRKFLKKSGLETSEIRFFTAHQSNNFDFVTQTGTVRHSYKPIIQTDFPNYESGSDGILMENGSSALAVVSADCVPLGVYHEDAQVFGLFHIGLLGTINGFATNIATFLTHLPYPTNGFRFLLGPYLSKNTYDINKSGLWTVIEPQVTKHADWVYTYSTRVKEHLYFDMAGAIIDQLVRCGFSANAISESNQITDHGEYYSNYRNKQFGAPAGNMLTVFRMTN